MRLHRFYIEEKIAGKKEIDIFDEAILHQLKNVFRLEAGDKIILFDGEGKDYECAIEILAKKEGKFVVEKMTDAFIPERKVTLFMSLIKKENFELAVEKATEIGISAIVPVMTERVQKKNIDIDRCRRIIKEAAEQCGRGDLPATLEITNLELGITNALKSGDEACAFDMSGDSIRNFEFVNRNCSLFIGPEGGWSDDEINLFKEKKIKMYSLGKTVLRAETAAIVASAFLIGN